MLIMVVYGLGGFAWCLYNGWWAGAALTAAWIAALIVLFSPSRHAWRRRRMTRGARASVEHDGWLPR